MAGPSERTSTKRLGRWRRWLRSIALGLLATSLLAFVGWFQRERLLAPLLLHLAREEVAARFGAELEVKRIGGSWVADLELDGIRWRAPGMALSRIDEASVRARYSLRALISGEPDWLRELAVVVCGVEVTIPDPEERPSDASETVWPELRVERLGLAAEDVRIVLPRRDVSLELHALSARGGMDGGRMRLDQLVATSGADRLSVAEAGLDLGSGGWKEILRGATGSLVLELQDLGRLRRLDPFPVEDPLRLELRAELRAGRAALTGRLISSEGRLAVERGELVMADGDHPFLDARLDLELDVEFDRLSPLAVLLDRPIDGTLVGGLSVSGTLRAPVGRLTAQCAEIELEGVPIDTATIEVVANGVDLRVERLEASGPGLECRASGSLAWDPLVLAGVELSLTSSAPAGFGLPAMDSISVQAQLAGPLLAPHGSFDVRSIGLALGTLVAQEVRARGTLSADAVEVDELVLTHERASLSAAGSVTRTEDGRFEVALSELSAESEGVACRLARPAIFSVGPGLLLIEGVQLETDTGSADVTFVRRDGEIRVAVDVDDFDPQPLVAPFLPSGVVLGTFDGSVSGTSSSAALDLAVGVVFEGVRTSAQGPVWTVDLEGRVSSDRVRIDRFEARSTAGATLRAVLEAPLDPADLERLLDAPLALEIEANGIDLAPLAGGGAPVVTGLASGTASLRGSRGLMEGTARIEVSGLALPRRSADLGPCELVLDVAFGERIALNGIEIEGPGLSARAAGSVGLTADLRLLLGDEPARAAWRRAELALVADVDLADVAWMADEIQIVRRLGGRASGRLEVGGTLGDPAWEGSLTLSEAELRLAKRVPSARDVSASVTFTEALVTVEELRGEVGGSPVEISGTIALDGEQPVLDVDIVGDNLLLARSAHLLVRANAKLSVGGPLDALRIGGELLLTEGRFAQNFDPVRLLSGGGAASGERGFSFTLWSEPPLSDARFDVTLRSLGDFQVSSNLVNSRLRPELTVGGTGRLVVLQGPILVGRSTVQLPSGRLEVRNGNLEFRSDDPFVPHLSLTGDMRVMGYLVNLVVTGPYDKPDVHLSSTPPLPHEDLLLLVLTGKLPEKQGSGWRQDAFQTLATYVAQDALTRWLFDRTADGGTSVFDYFEFEYGRQVSRTGQPLRRATFYPAGRTREVGRVPFVSTEIDEFDNINYGFGFIFRFK